MYPASDWSGRQRTTPWIAGIGPLSIIRTIAWRCSSLSFGGWPGDLPSSNPSGSGLTRTQSPIAADIYDLQRWQPPVETKAVGNKAEGMFENDDLDYPSNTHFDSSGGAYPGGVQQRCSS